MICRDINFAVDNLIITNTAKNFSFEEIVADKAFSARKNLEIVDKFGGTAYIPFKKNTSRTAKGSAQWKKMFHLFQYHQKEFNQYYHKRSNAESTFHAVKQRLNEAISSRNRVAQENELLCKVVCYNLTKLIQPMIELGISPDFTSNNENDDGDDFGGGEVDSIN